MSVLVAIKGKDRVVVGVDTRMSCGSSYSDSYKSRPKALHVNKEKTVIVGGVGNITLVDLFSSIVEDHLKTGEDIDRKYILRYMVPELIMQIDAYQIMPRDRDNTYIDGVLFLGIKDKGYVITGNSVFYIRVSEGVAELVERNSEGNWVVSSGNEKLVYTAASEDNPANVKLGNDVGAILPHTGGSGTKMMTILGMLLTIGAGIALLALQKRKGVIF